MADLIVRNLEEAVVQRLREQAAREGVSAEEAHRRLLRRTLLEEPSGLRRSFKEYLLEMPDLGDDPLFERSADPVRPVNL
jgi:hypothetical protein